MKLRIFLLLVGLTATGTLVAYFLNRDSVDLSLTQNPLEATDVAIKKGEVLYVENCAICHGLSGKGDGEAAADMAEKPEDLTQNTRSSIFPGSTAATITYGAGDGAMPAWGDILDPLEIWQLDLYVATLANTDQ